MSKKKKYWICIIEVECDGELPLGFDNPPRSAAIGAIEYTTDQEVEVISCYSGWGSSKETADKLLKVWEEDNNE